MMELKTLTSAWLPLLLAISIFHQGVQASFPFGKSAELVDEYENLLKGPRQLTELAELVCGQKNNSKIIGRVSTIIKLADFFATDNQAPTPALIQCKSKFGASIKSLKNVVTISNENVCSDLKVSAIEDFHKRFVSTLSEDVGLRQPGEGEVPRMLLNFFVHYTTQVSRMCKESIVASLEKDVKNRFPTDEEYAFEGISNQYTGKLMSTMGNFFNAVHHYDDILLIWTLVGKEKANQEKSLIVETTDEATGEPVKLLIVAKDIKPLVSAQQKCRQHFRPVYSKIVLPVSRLADIGYSFSDEKLKADEELLLKDNKLVELWYRLTQFCETILPIQFLQDANLDDRASAVITLDERPKYLEATSKVVSQLSPLKPMEYEPMLGLNTLPADEDKLRTIQDSDGELVVRKVKTSASARGRNISRFIARAVRGMKRTYTGNLRFSRKAALALDQGSADKGAIHMDGEFVVEDIKSLLSKPNIEKGMAKIEDGGDKQTTTGISKRDSVEVNQYADNLILDILGILFIVGIIVVIVLACLGTFG